MLALEAKIDSLIRLSMESAERDLAVEVMNAIERLSKAGTLIIKSDKKYESRPLFDLKFIPHSENPLEYIKITHLELIHSLKTISDNYEQRQTRKD